MKSLKLQVLASSEPEPQIVQIELRDMIIAGWTGRDQSAAVLRHIAELEKIGVKRPKRTPVFYRVAASLQTTETHVDVVGSESTGEIEFVLIQGREDLLIGLGSDHTDRKAETLGVTLSKQMCPKPIATETWRWEDIAVHWDQLQLRCVAHTSAGAVLYQEGSVTAMLHPLDLMARYTLFGGSFLPRLSNVLRDSRCQERNQVGQRLRIGADRSCFAAKNTAFLLSTPAACSGRILSPVPRMNRAPELPEGSRFSQGCECQSVVSGRGWSKCQARLPTFVRRFWFDF